MSKDKLLINSVQTENGYQKIERICVDEIKAGVCVGGGTRNEKINKKCFVSVVNNTSS